MGTPSRKVLVAGIAALILVAAAVVAIVALASHSGGSSSSNAAVSQLPSLSNLAATAKPRTTKPKASTPKASKPKTATPAAETLAFTGAPVYSTPHAGQTFVVRFRLQLVDATGDKHALPVGHTSASCRARAGSKPYTPGTATATASGVTCSWKVPVGADGATLVVIVAARAHGHEAPYEPLRTRVAAAPTAPPPPPPLVSNPPPASSPQPPSNPPPPAPASTVQAPPLILPP